jgi:oligoendopeptidase F
MNVRLLRHESGHGFQFFLNREQVVPEYLAGTFEVAEIPSMAFELITSPHLFKMCESSEKKHKSTEKKYE